MTTTATVRISVTDENGILLDTITVSREEFIAAQDSAAGALALLNDLSIGTQV